MLGQAGEAGRQVYVRPTHSQTCWWPVIRMNLRNTHSRILSRANLTPEGVRFAEHPYRNPIRTHFSRRSRVTSPQNLTRRKFLRAAQKFSERLGFAAPIQETRWEPIKKSRTEESELSSSNLSKSSIFDRFCRYIPLDLRFWGSFLNKFSLNSRQNLHYFGSKPAILTLAKFFSNCQQKFNKTVLFL